MIAANEICVKIKPSVSDAKPGLYEITVDLSDQLSGIYYYQIITNNFTKTQKMLLLK